MKTRVEVLGNNQFAIFDSSGSVYFQSYETIIARVDNFGGEGDVYILEGAYNFSNTTSKHLNRFLQEYTLMENTFCNKKGVEKLAKSGAIHFVEKF